MSLATVLQRFNLQGLRERLWSQRDRAFGLPVRDAVHVGGARPVRLADFDHALVLVVLALVAFGLVMVYSASVALADNPKTLRFAPTPTFFLMRHLLAISEYKRHQAPPCLRLRQRGFGPGGWYLPLAAKQG